MMSWRLMAMLLGLAAAAPTWALEPAEVAVVYNADYEGSKALAEYYVAKRGVPATNLVGLHAAFTENIDRPAYLKTIEKPIRDWLGQEDRRKRIRCVLLMRGVPLKIADVVDEKLQRAAEAAQSALKAVDNEKTQIETLKKRLEESAARDPARAEEVRVRIRELGEKLTEIETRRRPLKSASDQANQAWSDSVGGTGAAVDSELAVIYAANNPVKRWLPNMLNWRTWSIPGRERVLNTFMTSRLDGPNDALVKRIIDDSVAAEAKGLDGVAYVDARNLHLGTPGVPASFVDFDERVRKVAALVEKTGMKTVLDDREEVFAPGTCPDAALYCGWYSLEKYVPAFKWVPGSVGMHVASFEARWLRDPKLQEWCVKMIQEGVAVTFGATSEPFLNTFPDPVELFAFLLTGRYTMAEVYWYTIPVDSWTMTLVADPLYTPFKKNPKITIAQMREAIGMPPPSPAPRPAEPAQPSGTPAQP